MDQVAVVVEDVRADVGACEPRTGADRVPRPQSGTDVPRTNHYVLAIASIGLSLMAACTPDGAGTPGSRGESGAPVLHGAEAPRR